MERLVSVWKYAIFYVGRLALIKKLHYSSYGTYSKLYYILCGTSSVDVKTYYISYGMSNVDLEIAL